LARDELPKESSQANGRRRDSPSRALTRQGNPTRETLLAVLPASSEGKPCLRSDLLSFLFASRL